MRRHGRPDGPSPAAVAMARTRTLMTTQTNPQDRFAATATLPASSPGPITRSESGARRRRGTGQSPHRARRPSSSSRRGAPDGSAERARGPGRTPQPAARRGGPGGGPRRRQARRAPTTPPGERRTPSGHRAPSSPRARGRAPGGRTGPDRRRPHATPPASHQQQGSTRSSARSSSPVAGRRAGQRRRRGPRVRPRTTARRHPPATSSLDTPDGARTEGRQRRASRRYGRLPGDPNHRRSAPARPSAESRPRPGTTVRADQQSAPRQVALGRHDVDPVVPPGRRHPSAVGQLHHHRRGRPGPVQHGRRPLRVRVGAVGGQAPVAGCGWPGPCRTTRRRRPAGRPRCRVCSDGRLGERPQRRVTPSPGRGAQAGRRDWSATRTDRDRGGRVEQPGAAQPRTRRRASSRGSARPESELEAGPPTAGDVPASPSSRTARPVARRLPQVRRRSPAHSRRRPGRPGERKRPPSTGSTASRRSAKVGASSARGRSTPWRRPGAPRRSRQPGEGEHPPGSRCVGNRPKSPAVGQGQGAGRGRAGRRGGRRAPGGRRTRIVGAAEKSMPACLRIRLWPPLVLTSQRVPAAVRPPPPGR